MLGDKQREVGILRLLFLPLIAVSVYGYYAVCVFIYYDPMRVHTEGTDVILKFLRPVYDLALVKLVRQMGKNHRRKLNAHTYIDTVALCRKLQPLTDLLHPFAAASSDGNDALTAGCAAAFIEDPVSALCYLYIRNRRQKMKINAG